MCLVVSWHNQPSTATWCLSVPWQPRPTKLPNLRVHSRYIKNFSFDRLQCTHIICRPSKERDVPELLNKSCVDTCTINNILLLQNKQDSRMKRGGINEEKMFLARAKFSWMRAIAIEACLDRIQCLQDLKIKHTGRWMQCRLKIRSRKRVQHSRFSDYRWLFCSRSGWILGLLLSENTGWDGP